MNYTFGGLGTRSFSDPLTSAVLTENVVAFLRWATVLSGGTDQADANPYNNRNMTRLTPKGDKTTSDTWDGTRADWVWEAPYGRLVSEVVIDGVTYPASHPTKGFAVNYRLGRLKFKTPLPTTSDVRAAYTFRAAQARPSDDPWWVQADPYSLNGPSDNPTGGQGLAEASSQHRVQFPCWVVEPAGNVRQVPWEIGSTSKKLYTDVILHCFGTKPGQRDWLHDAALGHQDHYVPTFDTGEASGNGALDGFGNVVNATRTYPNLCESYPWRTVYVERATSSDFGSRDNSLFWAQVRWTLLVYVP